MDDTTAIRPTQPDAARAPLYPLGHSSAEFEHLERQALFLHDLSEQMFVHAGLREGMRVLDVGCGVGDVTLLAADLVGPSGRVLGVDRSAAAIATAKRRAAALGRDQADFTVADLDTLDIEGTFDAVIGRLVLMYLAEPAATLRRLCDHLRPGGVAAFQEMLSIGFAQSEPCGPVFERCRNWIHETFRRAGVECDMGGKLHATFLAAGLPAPQMLLLGRPEGGPQSPVYDYIAGVLRTIAPMAEQLGIATAEEIGVDTLAARLREEATRAEACLLTPPLVGAWAQLP